ncbi:MAG: VWA domain-containing protein [Holophagales bacterium]|nr:VWA domain-containing protein [Holophagales bacterium]MYF96087.1 VWA domain-containing protein [Holophagales bacterium]
MKSRRTLQVAWLLAAFLWATAPVPGQEVEIPEVFSETIDVRVVNVEVVVTDRQGNRVQGLKPSDFELLVNGKPTPIDYFTEIEDGFAAGGAAGDIDGVPALDLNAPVGTNFLIFIDDLFSIERDRNRVLDRLADDFGELGPADRIAAVAYDGQTAETLTAWTDSAADFQDALDRARSRPSHGVLQLSARSQVTQDRQLMVEHEAGRDQSGLLGSGQQASSGLSGDVSRMDLSYREKLSNQLESSVLAAMATMRRFANRPGRKVMLLLAGGWPGSVEIFARDTLSEDSRLSVDRRVMSQHDLYGPLVSTANLIGFSLYPVDVPGLTRDFFGDASRGFGANAQPDTIGAAPGALQKEDTIHSALHLLASSTGGMPLVNARRDIALASVVADTRSYYWLGFAPQRREDNRFHEIAVRLVGRADLDARTREGYVDMSRDHELDMTAKAALLFGDPPDALPLQVHFSEPVRAGRRKMSMQVEVAIPLDEIQLLPVAGEWLSVVEIRVTAMDEAGNRSEVSFEKVPIAGAQEPEPGQIFYYETELRLRRREHSYVITVHDPLTGTNLTSTGKVGPKSL